MKKLKRNLFVLFLLLVATGLVFANAQQEAADDSDPDSIRPVTLSWTAGGMGGGWYTTAGGMARIMNEANPDVTIKVIPGGGLANPLLISTNQQDIGWGVSYVDKAAYGGLAPLFEEKYDGFTGLAGNFSVDYYHYLTAKSTGITTFEQFVQKVKDGEKLNIGAPMSGTSERALTELLLEYYDISFEQISENGGRVITAAYADMTNAYKDRHVDFAFACLGLPGSAITEMTMSRPSTLMKIEDEVIDHFAKTLGTVPLSSGVSFVPGGTYKGMDQDIQTIGHSTQISASAQLPENVAYFFVKTLIEKIDEVQSLSPSFKKYFSKEGAPNTSVPLHPGAERYYKEAGLL